MFPATSLNKHILSILDRSKNLNHLKQLQGHLITLGHGKTHFYTFKLLRFCTVNLSNLSYARYIFDHFNSPNIYLYTAMITAYTSQSNHASSVLLFREMVRKNCSKPNEFIFPMVLKSSPEVVENYGTQTVHAQIVKLGFWQYMVVQTALLNAYSRYGVDIAFARKMFDEMPKRNVVSWTAMISGYTRVGEVGNAVLLFEEMPLGIRDTPFWNSIISGCVQNGLFSLAIEFFRRMVLEEGKMGISGCNKPNQVTVVCTLSACGHCGMLHFGKSIHTYIYRNGLTFDLFIANSLIDMYGKCGSLKIARMVFDRMKNVNLTSWNSVINCYALHGQIKEAINVFDVMMREVKPDGVTFVGLLNACTHGGLVEEGRNYYDMMIQEYGIEPQIEHYGCMVDLLGRTGRFEEAMEVVRGMRVPPDEVVWGSLLNGCRVHRQTELAELAVKKLIELNPNNGAYRAMLANLYGELGKWEEMWKVRMLMNEENAYKTPGCSWIEVDNLVHQFYSVDESHPKTGEIYAILECFVDSK